LCIKIIDNPPSSSLDSNHPNDLGSPCEHSTPNSIQAQLPTSLHKALLDLDRSSLCSLKREEGIPRDVHSRNHKDPKWGWNELDISIDASWGVEDIQPGSLAFFVDKVKEREGGLAMFASWTGIQTDQFAFKVGNKD
jgi:hypothetical protein